MPSNEMISLLSLQERDLEYKRAQRSLNAIPVERKTVEEQIRASEHSVETARSTLREAEVKRQKLEADTETVQEKINRLKTQQLQVKKNEEYQALLHEIDALETKIGTIEDEELEVLENIDQLKSDLETVQKISEKNREHHHKALTRIQKEEQDIRDGIGALKEKVDNLRVNVPDELLAQYDNLSNQIKRPPVAVPLRNQICSGCHLRVSNEVEAAVQNFKPVTCDQCGRMLFLE